MKQSPVYLRFLPLLYLILLGAAIQGLWGQAGGAILGPLPGQSEQRFENTQADPVALLTLPLSKEQASLEAKDYQGLVERNLGALRQIGPGGIYFLPKIEDRRLVLALRLRSRIQRLELRIFQEGPGSPLPGVLTWDSLVPVATLKTPAGLESSLPVLLDGRFVEWLGLAALEKRRLETLPLAIHRQESGQRRGIDPKDALFWHKAGTDLDSFKLLSDKTGLSLMLGSYSPMEQGLCWILRLYDPENHRQPAAVFELPLAGSQGSVLLWDSPRQNPKAAICGSWIHNGFFLEATIWQVDLPAKVRNLLSRGDWELSAWFDSGGVAEEYLLFAWQGLGK